MKLLSNFFLLACSTFLITSHSIAQLTPAKMGSSMESSSEIKPMERYQKPAQPTTTPSIPVLPEPVAPQTKVAQHAEYLHPGILVNIDGNWQGSDHLLNISKNIGVYVQLIKPEGENLSITEEDLQKQVESIFSGANIKPLTMASPDQPPLPGFQIEIFVYPIDRGYAAFLDGRLFEAVTLDRFKMDPGMAFQAITWEKQALIVSPKAKISEQLTNTVQDIASTFVSRYQTFEKLKQSSMK